MNGLSWALPPSVPYNYGSTRVSPTGLTGDFPNYTSITWRNSKKMNPFHLMFHIIVEPYGISQNAPTLSFFLTSKIGLIRLSLLLLFIRSLHSMAPTLINWKFRVHVIKFFFSLYIMINSEDNWINELKFDSFFYRILIFCNMYTTIVCICPLNLCVRYVCLCSWINWEYQFLLLAELIILKSLIFV